MSVLWFPLLAYLIVLTCRKRDPSIGLLQLILRRWYWAIAPLVLAVTYMTLNYLRFGSILEFGHNYLPEFTRTETGQFHLCYLLPNLGQYLRFPQWNGEDTPFGFSSIDGNAFYLLNPLLVLFIVLFFAAVRHRKDHDRVLLVMIPLLVLLYFVLICLHKTLGGVQFGNRYLVDLMPCAYLGLLLWLPEKESWTGLTLVLTVWGAAINLIGTVLSYNNWL